MEQSLAQQTLLEYFTDRSQAVKWHNAYYISQEYNSPYYCRTCILQITGHDPTAGIIRHVLNVESDKALFCAKCDCLLDHHLTEYGKTIELVYWARNKTWPPPETNCAVLKRILEQPQHKFDGVSIEAINEFFQKMVTHTK